MSQPRGENSLTAVEVWTMARAGRRLVIHGRMADARKVFRGLVAARPDYGFAWHMLGNLHRRAQRQARAADCYRRRLELEPDAVESRVALAEVLRSMDRLPQASATLAVLAERTKEPTDSREARLLARARVLRERWSGG